MKQREVLPGMFSTPEVPLPERPRFDGAEYVPPIDDARLTGQMRRVWDAMSNGTWRTLEEISTLTGDPAASVSAQLRHFRKKRFGAHTVERRARGDRANGLFEYRIVVTK